jgi:hypothetical protein
MRITSGGNVEQGTVGTTASAYYYFNATTTADTGIIFKDNSTTNSGFLTYNHSSDSMKFGTNTSLALTISSGGDVDVGGTYLAVSNSSDPTIRCTDADDANYAAFMKFDTTNNVMRLFPRHAGTYYDSNLVLDRGNVGIGTDSPTNLNSQTSLTIQGTSISRLDLLGASGAGGGVVFGSATGLTVQGNYGVPLTLDAGTGADMLFNIAGSNKLTINSGGVLTKNGDSTTARIIPETDNAGYLGQATHRWQAVYAVNGTIQTSDRNEKTLITTSDLGLDFILKLEPVSYKWKVGGWDIKENEKDEEPTKTPIDGKRNHYGLIAQQVKEVIGDKDFGGWVKEDLEDDASMESLRYAEFISPMIKAIQEQQTIIEDLKARIETLEG